MDEKLLQKLQDSPSNVSFPDLTKLVKQLGWSLRNQKGSHHIFTHPDARDSKDMYPRPLNLQCMKNGKAKPEQVREVLKRARAMGLIENREHP